MGPGNGGGCRIGPRLQTNPRERGELIGALGLFESQLLISITPRVVLVLRQSIP